MDRGMTLSSKNGLMAIDTVPGDDPGIEFYISGGLLVLPYALVASLHEYLGEWLAEQGEADNED